MKVNYKNYDVLKIEVFGCPDEYEIEARAICDDVSDYTLDTCKVCWEESLKDKFKANDLL